MTYNKAMIKKHQRLLSVDPGTKHTGWACFIGKNYDCSDVVSVTNHKLSWLQRLDLMTVEVVSLCKKHNVDIVIIEEPQLFIGSLKGRAASNSGAVLKLTALVYSIRSLCKSRGLQVLLVPVQRWKGQVPKEVMQGRLEKQLGRVFTDNNESDAVGLGLWFLKNS